WMMDGPLCRRLDDYLAHGLLGSARDDFGGHLGGCPECRAAVHAPEQVAGRLGSACEGCDSVPAELAVSVSVRRAARGWRLRALPARVVAASIGFVALWLSRDGSTPDGAPKNVSEPMASAAPSVRISFPGHKTLALPVESDSPNVTVLLVYPNLQSEPLD